MPQKKQNQKVQSQPLDSDRDFTRILPSDVTQNVLGLHLPNSDILNIYQTSRKFKGLFQPRVDILKPLKAIVEGNADALIALIKDNPGLLFKKGDVKAPRGQIYYNISPYMLIKFLCDEDMFASIMPLIPERCNQVIQDQDAEIGRGGSDLVKLDFDPMSVTSDEFNKICAFKTSIEVGITSTDITFPLLENPDGLLYWKNAQGKVNFYYANREKQTIVPIIPVATTPEEQQDLDAFKDSFNAMENNSARRSTNKEHQLIVKLMKQDLYRQGIHYSDALGEDYCDSHTPFQLINRYRTSMRLKEEAEYNNEYERADRYWQEDVGGAQGEEMWLLQRICEKSRPFWPLPKSFADFKRGFGFYNYITREHKSAFNDGKLVEGLGSNFALYKGTTIEAWVRPNPTFAMDLVAVCQLVENAKAKTIGLAPESDQVVQLTFGPQH